MFKFSSLVTRDMHKKGSCLFRLSEGPDWSENSNSWFDYFVDLITLVTADFDFDIINYPFWMPIFLLLYPMVYIFLSEFVLLDYTNQNKISNPKLLKQA